jgi:hypothetical protein
MYRINFTLIQNHPWSLTELEAMVPFERELYLFQLIKQLEEEQERKKRQAGVM